jgi:hypothetical protein
MSGSTEGRAKRGGRLGVRPHKDRRAARNIQSKPDIETKGSQRTITKKFQEPEKMTADGPVADHLYANRAQRACSTPYGLLRQAAAGGLVAGITAALYLSLAALLLQDDLMLPARMVAAILLGPDALNRWYSPGTVAVVGLGIHGLLSLLFGIIFGLLLVRRPAWRHSPLWLAAAAVMYGAALWFLNFYLFAPLFDWLWFMLWTHPFWQGLIGHSIFFGAVLGLFMAYRCLPPE